MNDSEGAKRVLRWILVLPAALVATIAVAFPIHWVVMFTLGGWGRDPIIEIEDRDTLKAIEVFLQGILGPYAFVYAGARTAPSRQLVVGVVLACIVVVGMRVLVVALLGSEGLMQVAGVSVATNLGGAVAGVLVIRHYVRRERARLASE